MPGNARSLPRVLLPSSPVTVKVTGADGQALSNVDASWDAGSHTEYLGFDNSPEGVRVTINW